LPPLRSGGLAALRGAAVHPRSDVLHARLDRVT
jgi:hypothetical protein